MRLASYNVEWFEALFDARGGLRRDGEGRRHGVSRAAQIDALAHVFRALDADGVMVIEGPDDRPQRPATAALEGFAAGAGLRASRAVLGFANHTQQEILFLHDPETLDARHDPRGAAPFPGAVPEEGPVRFDGRYPIDLDVDNHPERVTFSKPPLELAVRTRAGRELRLIGVHLKSKAPHGASSSADLLRLAIANRRKQLAQAIWLRDRVSAHLAAGESVIVMGDLNDGPGIDQYESLFGRSSVEIVLGGPGEIPLYDPHAARGLERRLAPLPTSARFFLASEGRWLQALLDYILVSPDLRGTAPRWRIWHPFEDAECYADPALREALLLASDHFPVTLDFDV